MISEKLMSTICSYMIDDIREDLHAKLAPCDNLVFIRNYCTIDSAFMDFLYNEFPDVYKALKEMEK